VLVEKTRSMLHGQNLPLNLWAEALQTANYVRNRSPYKQKQKTPYELLTGKQPKVGHLRVFGSRSFIHIPKDLRTKLDPVSEEGIFLGYDPMSKAYRFLVHGRIKVSRNATIDESTTSTAEAAPADDTSDTDSEGDIPPVINQMHHDAEDEPVAPPVQDEGAREMEPHHQSPEREERAVQANPQNPVGQRVRAAFKGARGRPRYYTGTVTEQDTEEGTGRTIYHIE